MKATPPIFDASFRRQLQHLMKWRRDVRRFKTDLIDLGLIREVLEFAELSPSVGDSRPWRFLEANPAQRERARASFEICNAQALAAYDGERAALYARLKLEGMRDAPVQFAVFCDHSTARGAGLGRQTMPETLDYSVVAAITNLWLAARAHGIGVGWVSILDPHAIHMAMGVPQDWRLIAWLCVGWPVEEHCDPELQRAGWTEAD